MKRIVREQVKAIIHRVLIVRDLAEGHYFITEFLEVGRPLFQGCFGATVIGFGPVAGRV